MSTVEFRKKHRYWKRGWVLGQPKLSERSAGKNGLREGNAPPEKEAD